MPTIIATPGASDANSYVTVSEADDYLSSRLNASAWTDASAPQRIAALIEAQRTLTPLGYIGRRATETQALAWPRERAPNPDDPFGRDYSTAIVPQRVKDAACELALEFLNAGTADLAAISSSQNVIREKVDVLEVQYSEPQDRITGLAQFPRIIALLTPLWVGVGSLRVLRS
jgi:hypothetical protein